MTYDQASDRARRYRHTGPCRLGLGAAGALATLVLLLGSRPAQSADPVEFNRDIRPILSENCFFCHGPDKKHRDSGLRLDIRDEALAKEAIVPGKPEESELIDRITSDDEFERMPPKKSTKRLTKAQKSLLQRWIAEGAEYQPHWAYVVPERPAVPTVKARDRVRNPVDAFVLKTLEAKKLTPAPEADRRTLLRRLSLDLTGLPPTPAEVAAFLADADPQAYERQVDRLLDSPHFGERMAVPWLDLARFTDTVGYHGDQNQRIFPYRDYVIAAFNDNKPFDEFTIEQLAGDLLPDPTAAQLVATGFNRLNMMTREGGAQPKEYLAKYAADRVRTVAATWLGATLGCAECHDHKFDPFTTRDFYRLEAFFADVKQWGVYADYGYTPNPELKGWNNDYPFPPEIKVACPYQSRGQAGADRAADPAALRDGGSRNRPIPRRLAAWIGTSAPRALPEAVAERLGPASDGGRGGAGHGAEGEGGTESGDRRSPAGSHRFILGRDGPGAGRSELPFDRGGRQGGPASLPDGTRAGVAGRNPPRSAASRRARRQGGRWSCKYPGPALGGGRAGGGRQGDAAGHCSGRRRPQGPALFEHSRVDRRPHRLEDVEPARGRAADRGMVARAAAPAGRGRSGRGDDQERQPRLRSPRALPVRRRGPAADRGQPEPDRRAPDSPGGPHARASRPGAGRLPAGHRSRRRGPGEAAGAPGRVARVS